MKDGLANSPQMQANKSRFYGTISVFCAQLREMKLMRRQVSEGCQKRMEENNRPDPSSCWGNKGMTGIRLISVQLGTVLQLCLRLKNYILSNLDPQGNVSMNWQHQSRNSSVLKLIVNVSLPVFLNKNKIVMHLWNFSECFWNRGVCWLNLASL